MEKVEYYFREISKIPRGSYNEKAICDYVENFAKERNITKEELMKEAILEYLDDYKIALTLRKARLNGETGESWQSVKKELGL